MTGFLRLLLVAFFVSAAGGIGAQTSLPRWFWVPPGEDWATVFAASDSDAVKAASQVLAAYHHSRVEGDFQQFFDDTIDARTWRNTDYHYWFDDSERAERERTLAVWDRAPISDFLQQGVYLVGPSEGGPPVARTAMESPPLPEGLELAASAGRSQALGRFTLQGNPADAWIKAEELAVFELLNQNVMDFRQRTASTGGAGKSTFSSIEWVHLRLELTGLRVDGRWIDPEHNDALVLVSVPSGTIHGLSSAAAPPGRGLDPFAKALSATTPSARPTTLLPAASPLPRRADLSQWLPPVRNQGQIASCAAWSTVYYVRTLLEQRERGWGADVAEHQFSPLFSFLLITGGENHGTAITSHMQILRDRGVTLADFPNTDRLDLLPSEALKSRPSDLTISEFRSVPRTESGVDLAAVKRLLSEGNPVIGGFSLFEDFYNYSGGVYSTTQGTAVGGHAMAVVGYDDDLQALKIVNSWGSDWGDHGFAWLSYDSVRVMTRDNYGFAVMYDQPDRPDEPVAPVDLTATQGASANAITLTWTPSPSGERAVVLRADNTTREWEVLGESTTNRFVDQPLPRGVTYVYAVRTQRDSGGSAKLSPLGPVAEGWTQKASSVPGVVQDLEGLVIGNSVVLVWSPLVDTERYEVYRYFPDTEDFREVGITKDAVFRDGGASEKGSSTYMVVGVNAQGQGPPGNSREVQSALSKPSREPESLLRKTRDDKPTPAAARKTYQGSYTESDWFDPRFLDAAFVQFAEQERQAFANWRSQDEKEFEAFLKEDLR